MNLWNMKRTAKTKYQRAGFTLLELLVVISIIGILTAIGMVAFSEAQKKGRDAKRIGDMKAIQAAAEQYYSKNGNYASAGSCSPLVTDNGMAFPTDPKTKLPYALYCDGAQYCACADLDGNSGNRSTAATTANCGTLSTTGGFFCVRNLQ